MSVLLSKDQVTEAIQQYAAKNMFSDVLPSEIKVNLKHCLSVKIDIPDPKTKPLPGIQDAVAH